MRLFHYFMAVFLVLAMVATAQAQSTVSARIGAHADYSRLVVEWPEKPAYTLSKEGARILVRFSKAGAFDASGFAASGNILKLETLSTATEPLQLAITIPEGSKFRDFMLENKLVLDVYNPAGQAAPAPAAQEKTPAPKSENVPTPVAEKTPEPEAPKPAPVEETKTPAPTTQEGKADFSQVTTTTDAVPAPSVEAQDVPKQTIEDHSIEFTATYSVGMAAYQRSGFLWVVFDDPNLPAQPSLKGPAPAMFGKLESVSMVDGSAFRLEMPEGMHAYGEGGGLSWKIVLTQKPRKTSPIIPAADDSKGDVELVWPLKSMRKHLTFNDPIVGDVIDIVTAGRSSEYVGPSREYVNLKSLDSVIGLAFVRKSDGLKTSLNTQQVRVGKPGGLEVSRSSNVPPPIETVREKKMVDEETVDLDKEHEKEQEEKAQTDLSLTEEPPAVEINATAKEETESHETIADLVAETVAATMTPVDISKAVEEKPQGNNIYNFPRWDLGGVRALNQNQHALMMEISGKDENARVEDIINLAKINLANNRGPEALGLLRIALQKVPQLEGNPEFQALRGAAFALGGKYDEAIIDFSQEDLKKFDDVKFWRVFTLAGLEDWGQAISEMPSDVSPIASYPSAVRTPMALALAEISLRAGKVPVAQGILKTLEADLPNLTLPYVSAWQYLSGEAQRQSGNPDRAISSWEPLVKDGKDDLYRAKAGLSLTRLELDEKKIKPEDAINRLEGLRYAWRGDELETLINYRLGQVYIDNNDYLKGLTVLRNASTLSPGTDISKDVKAYMAKSFNDVFTKDLVKDMSPLEAISVYEEFKDLSPKNEEANRYVEKLAERLVEADMLGRASILLEHHVNNNLKGGKKAEIAIRLAAIRLLDGNPDGALRSLDVAQAALNAPAAAATPATAATPAAGETAATQEAAQPNSADQITDAEKQRQIHLLRARALSMKGKPAEALAILEEMPLDPDVNRLKTDIAWTSGKWEEAAVALNDLIAAEDISARRPLTDYQREIIFNRAIALNLSGNRVALANLRERYNTQMGGTPRGQMFEIVTRPRRPDMIGSREAIESMISEIDLFQGFLDGYGKMNKGDEKADVTDAPAETPAAETPPAEAPPSR